jgi:all-trans-8'-apo-beta-carotenal 15,15'-oxygenase
MQTQTTEDQTARRAPKTPRPDLTAQLWKRSLQREHGFESLLVEGRLPPELVGTIYRNGPGLFESFGRRYTHPFEADGALSAVRLDGKGATGAVRITDSKGLREERAAGETLYGFTAPWLKRVRNMFGKKFKNTANTAVISWQGRILALMEGSIPTEIDAADLKTVGETDLGCIRSMFSAHPHRVAARKTTYNFGLEYGRKNRIHLYALPDEGAARHEGTLDLDGGPMLHDFIATDTHLVFFLSPVRVVLPRMFLQVGGFDDMFRWRPELGTQVICVPLGSDGRARVGEALRFQAEPFYQWHFANAFTRGRELVIDYVRYPDFASFYELADPSSTSKALATSTYHRAVVGLDTKTLRSEQLLDRSCEFPKVHPDLEGAAHRYAWLLTGDLSGIGRLDTETGALVEHVLPADQRGSEPIFVPRAGGGEGEGHVLSLCADGGSDRSFLAIYDAARLPDGPVAKVWFDHQIPITFHGTWQA